MNSLAVATRIKAVLEAAVWPGVGGEKVFGLVVVTAGVDRERFLSQAIVPFAAIVPGSQTVDDETEDLLTEEYTITLVQRVDSDTWGEHVLIGGPGTGDGLNSQGRGLLELQTVLYDELQLLDSSDTLSIQLKGASAVAADLDDSGANFAFRAYTFEAWTGAGSAP